MTHNWENYYKLTEEKISPLLLQALLHVNTKRKAVDIGAGALAETRFLLNQGFEVVAIDKHPSIADRANALKSDRLKAMAVSFYAYSWEKETFDLAVAIYSLPFNSPDTIELVFEKIKHSLVVGGVFCGQLFGIKDSWSDSKEMSFNSIDQVYRMIGDFEILHLNEIENDAPTAAGNQKHWHVFDLIIRKQ